MRSEITAARGMDGWPEAISSVGSHEGLRGCLTLCAAWPV
jgi:hypothetical protein